MSAPIPIPPINAQSEVDIQDSCNCRCCFGFRRSKPSVKEVSNNRTLSDVDITVTHVRAQVMEND